MRLLVSWVRDFVDVSAPPAAIADRLALRGFEVASVEPCGDGDGVIDFEVTANRPDCLSVVGLAREIGAAYDLPVRTPAAEALPVSPDNRADQLRVTLEDAALCPRYVGAVADVTAASSPAWLTDRLQAAGVRAISPFVDITNYVLLELGHPMHAFDLASLSGGELRIRRAAAGETLVTLDGAARTLDPEMLVIADATRPQAIAGVMGGAGSEVSGATRLVAFESAYFQPASIRRTSKRLGLKTEASARFERGTDVNAPARAMARAIALMQQLGAGRLRGPLIDCYPMPRGPRTLTLRRARLALVLGMTVPDAEVMRILRALGLDVASSADGWTVTVPTFRVDLLREVDLIEEVGRHHGFDKLDAAFPVLQAPPPLPDPRIARDQMVRRALTAAGITEAVTFGFIELRAARAFVASDASLVAVANPLSAKFDTLRPSLLPGLVDAVAHNRRHGIRDVALFEIAARFDARGGETRGVGVALTGAAHDEHWSTEIREATFFDVKGLVERVCAMHGAPITVEPAVLPYLVDGQSAVVRSGAAEVAVLGLLRPEIAESRGAPAHDRMFVAEINLDALWSAVRIAPGADPFDTLERVRDIPRHPSIVRDVSIVVSDALPAEIIRGTIHTAAAAVDAPLVGVSFFDRYAGSGIAAGAVSLSIRLTFRAADRTLTDADVQAGVDAIVQALTREHGATRR